MHIDDWNPKYSTEIYWRKHKKVFLSAMSAINLTSNIIRLCLRKSPYERWPWRPHGEQCACSFCRNIRLYFRRYLTIQGERIEVSIISDGIENEIEIYSGEGGNDYRPAIVMFLYNLTDHQFLDLLHMKSPFIVPSGVIDDKTFMAAFRRGEVRGSP
jgi:hypothetical protein